MRQSECQDSSLPIQNSSMHSDYFDYKDPPSIFGNRVFGMLLSFDLTHSDAVEIILAEYLSMCEAGWNVTLMFYTTEAWSAELFTLTRRRTYCYRINESIGIKFSVHAKSLGTSLSAQHRSELREHLPHYDIFIYQEDDIIFKFKHLISFVEETAALRSILPPSDWLGYGIGFLRFRRIMRHDAEIHSQAWGATDVIEQDMLEELPNLRPICLGQKQRAYLSCEGNTHQAMWILTKDQVI
jgi:hypothetical protein